MARNATKQDEQVSSVSKGKTLIRLFSYLLDYRGLIAVVFLIMAAATTISIINPLIIERAINVNIANSDTRGLIILGSVGIGLNLVLVFLIKARMYLMAKMSNDVLAKVRKQLYEHIQTLGFGFFDSRPTGKILSRIMGDVNSMKDVLSNSVTTLI